MNTVMTNPPANASTANRLASFVTVERERSSGAPVAASLSSSSGERPWASHRHTAAPSGKTRNQALPVGVDVQKRCTKAGPPASSAPSAPAR